MDFIKIKSREQIEKEMREDYENDPSLDGFAKSVALGMCEAMSHKVHELYLLAEHILDDLEGKADNGQK